MEKYQYITLREKPDLKNSAAEWFHSKWKVPTEAYLECMDAYLQNETEYGWYFCIDGNQIIGGMGVIENDFRYAALPHRQKCTRIFRGRT